MRVTAFFFRNSIACVRALLPQPPPTDLPSALARIAELEDSEYRLRVALQEALTSLELKNKVLEDTATYVESLEGELKWVSCCST